MIAELDAVELIEAYDGIPAGTQGAVVMLHAGACDVEFPDFARETVAVPLDRLKLVWSAPRA